MASDSHRTRETSDGGMINLSIKVTFVGIKKKSTVKLNVPKSSNIRDLLFHLKASKGIAGRLMIPDKRLNDKTTLAEAGIIAGAVILMESYTPSKRFTHNIPVKLPGDAVINVHVHSGTTVEELKHKIQDVIGIPVEKLDLECAGKLVKPHNVIDVCGHKKTPIVLKVRGKFEIICHYILLAGNNN